MTSGGSCRLHHDHGVPGREVDACRQGDLVPEVAREPDHAEPGVGVRGVQHQLACAIAAAVVDQDGFGITVERVHDVGETRHGLGDHPFLVVRRDYE